MFEVFVKMLFLLLFMPENMPMMHEKMNIHSWGGKFLSNVIFPHKKNQMVRVL